jgi:cysteinyl-tRNA synthetase
MPIYIHNSLTRKKEEFIPLDPPKVNIYSCGVTVYDDCHIGHARSLYIFDLIRGYLKFRGFDVNFVRNITDIDDKIINRSNELKTDWQGLVKKYIDRYYEDLGLLGIPKADKEPRATENITDMIKHIELLIRKGHAYVTDTGVYFSVRNFKDYGRLSGQSIEQMLTGVRKESDETKEDPLDFALWKRSKPAEPFWPSPWGDGRPGWHIECSVMSSKYLATETLDIHAGGRDLIFPHHENEIAQSEALTGKQFAKYWIHHGLLTINSQKMAKSLGNFITIKDFLDKYRDSDILKLFFLSTHYSHPIDYNTEKIEESKKQKKIFYEFFDRVNNWDMADLKPKAESSAKDIEKIDDIADKFEKAMDDDFNTPQALGHLFELADLGSKFVSQDKKEAFIYTDKRLKSFLGIFGIKEKPKTTLPAEMLLKVKERAQARKNKDFKKADELREDIKKMFNYFIEDTSGTYSGTAI